VPKSTYHHIYLDNSAFWKNDDSWDGFKWICADDYTQSVISFRRIDTSDPNVKNEIITVCNFVPVRRENYRIGVPYEGSYELILNSDDVEFGGSGVTVNKTKKAEEFSMHGCDYSIEIDIAPFSAVMFRYVPPKPKKKRAPSAKQTEKAAPQDKNAPSENTAKAPKTAARKRTPKKAAKKEETEK
jgi:1,4-alpha-glucan branching enzyme